MDTQLKELTVARAHDGYRSGKFTTRQVVEYHLERIQKLDKADSGPHLNSILAVSSTALAEADALDAHLKTTSELKGSLHGIPVVIKDQADTKCLTTTYGSIVAKDNVPSEDATLVAKLKAAGAIVLAKTTMPGIMPRSLLTTLNIATNIRPQTGQRPGTPRLPCPASRATRTTSNATPAVPAQAQAPQSPQT